VLRCHAELGHELCQLHAQLRDRSWRPGPYRTSHIREPKVRLISAAPYRERVVQHALVNVLGPIDERCSLYDSYACRKGKGTHAAVRRVRHYLRRHRWVWQADIRKFFPSLDHAILKSLLARKVSDPDVRGLADLLIDHSNAQEPVQEGFPGDDRFTGAERRRGLPLGNQTSQSFANVYLDPLDHFLKDRLRLPGYVRYVDDFVAFADGRQTLAEARRRAVDFLPGLRLRLYPTKDAIFPARQGVRFLGYRALASHVKLAPENVYRFRRRLRLWQHRYERHEIDGSEVAPRLASWIGHACQADTYLLRERLFEEHRFRREADTEVVRAERRAPRTGEKGSGPLPAQRSASQPW
jgi:retron-type reverse transcriptase